MGRYINILLITIIIVTLKNGTVRTFEADRYTFRNYNNGCDSIRIWKQAKKIGSYDKTLATFTCNSVISVEEK